MVNTEYIKRYLQYVDLEVLFNPLKEDFWQHEMGQDFHQIKTILTSESKLKDLLKKPK